MNKRLIVLKILDTIDVAIDKEWQFHEQQYVSGRITKNNFDPANIDMPGFEYESEGIWDPFIQCGDEATVNVDQDVHMQAQFLDRRRDSRSFSDEGISFFLYPSDMRTLDSNIMRTATIEGVKKREEEELLPLPVLRSDDVFYDYFED